MLHIYHCKDLLNLMSMAGYHNEPAAQLMEARLPLPADKPLQQPADEQGDMRRNLAEQRRGLSSHRLEQLADSAVSSPAAVRQPASGQGGITAQQGQSIGFSEMQPHAALTATAATTSSSAAAAPVQGNPTEDVREGHAAEPCRTMAGDSMRGAQDMALLAQHAEATGREEPAQLAEATEEPPRLQPDWEPMSTQAADQPPAAGQPVGSPAEQERSSRHVVAGEAAVLNRSHSAAAAAAQGSGAGSERLHTPERLLTQVGLSRRVSCMYVYALQLILKGYILLQAEEAVVAAPTSIRDRATGFAGRPLLHLLQPCSSGDPEPAAWHAGGGAAPDLDVRVLRSFPIPEWDISAETSPKYVPAAKAGAAETEEASPLPAEEGAHMEQGLQHGTGAAPAPPAIEEASQRQAAEQSSAPSKFLKALGALARLRARPQQSSGPDQVATAVHRLAQSLQPDSPLADAAAEAAALDVPHPAAAAVTMAHSEAHPSSGFIPANQNLRAQLLVIIMAPFELSRVHAGLMPRQQWRQACPPARLSRRQPQLLHSRKLNSLSTEHRSSRGLLQGLLRAARTQSQGQAQLLQPPAPDRAAL